MSSKSSLPADPDRRSVLSAAKGSALDDIPDYVEWAPIPTIARSLSIGVSTAWEWIRRGILPPPIRPTPGVTRLNVRLVREYLQHQQQESLAASPDLPRYKACHSRRAKRRQLGTTAE